MSTVLEDVGLQVWRGALLMADFLLSHKEIFRDNVVLELGGGVGLSAIIASLTCSTVFCTGTVKNTVVELRNFNYILIDFKTSILDICRRNIKRYQESVGGTENIAVKLLDWASPFKQGKYCCDLIFIFLLYIPI